MVSNDFPYRKQVTTRTSRRRSLPYRIAGHVLSNITPERDTRLGDALAYVVTGNFDRKAVWENEGGAISGMGDALKQFEKAARDGKVNVWGKRENWSVYDPIPADYWSTHGVDFLDLFRPETDVEAGRSPLRKNRPNSRLS